MARSQETFSKKEKEKKRLKKRQDKLVKKEERKANAGGGDLDSMIAYVDEYGRIVDTPPDLTKKKKIDADSIELGVPKRDQEEVDPIMEGKLIYFNDQKGYGFIKDNFSEEKYFVHINNMLDDIAENDKVHFEIEKGPKGLNAVRVKQYKKPEVVINDEQSESTEEQTNDRAVEEDNAAE